MYVEEDMTHTDASGAEDISLRRGVQELSGADSYGYLRYIDPEEGEIGRIQREERFFKALFAQAQNHLRVYMWGLVRYYWSAAATNLTKKKLPPPFMIYWDFLLKTFTLSSCPARSGRTAALPSGISIP